MVEVVVQDHDNRRLEKELLSEGFAAVLLHVDGGRAVVVEIDRGARAFWAGCGGPFVMDGSAIGAKLELRSDTRFGALGGMNRDIPAREPAASGGRDVEFLGADFLAVDHVAELAFLRRYGAGIGRRHER